MKFAQYVRLTIREGRRSRRRLLLFVACLAVGVGAIVTVATLSASVQEGVRTEAKAILGGDVVINSRQPLPDDFEIEGVAARTSVRELITVAASPMNVANRSSTLVTLKAIDGEYPLFGKMGLEPAVPLAELLTAESTVVAPELLPELGVEVGDTVMIGGQPYRIAGTVLSEPQRLGFNLPIGPRVILSGEGLARVSTLGRGLGVEYTTLLKLPAGAGDDAAVAFRRALDDSLPSDQRYRVSSYVEAQPRVRRRLRNIANYLGLVGLLSLLIGAVGVAQTVRAWIAERIESIAVLRCIGMRPGEVCLLYAGQTLLLGLCGSALGAALGVGTSVIVPTVILPDLIPPEFIHPWQPLAILQGLALGVGISLLFSLPPLLDIRRIPPALVLRRDAEPLRARRGTRVVVGTVLALSVWGAASWQAGSMLIGLVFLVGLAIVGAILALSAIILTAVAGRTPREGGPLWIRHGLGRLARPGAATLSSIVALGLGVMIVMTVHLVERHLTGELSAEMPEAPTAFLMNVRPEQVSDVRSVMMEHGAESIDIVPIVRARIRAVDGTPVESLIEQRRERRRAGGEREGTSTWALRREQRLTYRETLHDSNRLVEGEFWSDPDVKEISVEEAFAGELGVGIGSTITIAAGDEEHELAVTSIRSVNWRTVSTNFFLIVEPGVLEGAEQVCVASARLPEGGDEAVQTALATKHPNISLFRVREIAELLLGVLQRVSIGVQMLGGFTVAAGILILAGAISANYARRGREVALLKTIGMTRRQISTLLAVEYALVGLAAAVIGGAAGSLLAWAVLEKVMEIEWVLRPLTYLVAVGGTTVLVVVAGLAASVRAMAVRPIEVLRAQ